MATVLITGAGGFVGRHIAASHAAHGDRVLLVDRAFDAELVDAWRGRDAAFFRADAASFGEHVREGVDAIVHAAAVTAHPAEIGLTSEAYLEQEVGTALAALSWAEEHQVGRRLLLSSGGVFAGSDAEIFDEETPVHPASHYALAKHLIEQVVAASRAIDGRDAVCVRLGDVFGPEERPRGTRPRVSTLQRLLDEARGSGVVMPTAGAPRRAWSFAPDLGEAVHALVHAERPAHALYHLSSDTLLDECALAAEIVRVVPGARVVERPSSSAPARPRGRFVADRFREEFPMHTWTPFPEALRRCAAMASAPGASA
ncbi:MAG: NAD(P)-dependent oxidoreductase [Trueperaceae bacterium]|nr:NAD(P)-dependent oxidoreductase [Trueperaceae bacterium]